MAVDEWPETKCLQLIREFEERPVLWNQKHPLYYQKANKPGAWDEIAEVLNVPSDQCRHKMGILMSSFRREKPKILNAPKHGRDPNIPYHSSWFGFKAMAFLLGKDKERIRQLEETLNDKKDSENSTDNDKIPSIATQQPPVMQNDKLTLGPSKRPAATPVLVDQQHPTISQINDDEIKYFSHFIASKMMKYSEANKNAVQRAICDIIFKADQNCYEQTPNEMCATAEADPLNETGSVTEQQPSSSVYNDPIKEYFSDSD